MRQVVRLGGVAMLYYVSMRLLERHTLRNLPTAAAASTYSWRKLFRLAVRAERARVRRKCTVLTKANPRIGIIGIIEMLVIFLVIRIARMVPSRDYRGLLLSFLYALLLRSFDDVVDGDLEPSEGTRPEMFDHITELIGKLANPKDLSGPIRAEELALLFIIRGCAQLLGFDPTDTLQRTWAEYAPDAQRIIDNEVVTDQATLNRALTANELATMLSGLMLGLNSTLAWRYAKLDTASNLACNNMRGLLKDCKARRLNIPKEVFQRYEISLDDLLLASSWGELAEVPGLAAYYVAESKKNGMEWDTRLLPALLEEVLPHIRPWLARKIFQLSWEKRTKLFGTYHDWWSNRLPATGE